MTAATTPADPTLDALAAAVLENPASDAVRLVYADRLDEVAVETWCARCNGSRIDPNESWQPLAGTRLKCRDCAGSGRTSDGNAERAEFVRVQVELAALSADRGGDGRTWKPEELKRRDALRRREKALIADHWLNWLAELSLCKTWRHPKDALAWEFVGTEPDLTVTFRRGFVASVTLPCGAFIGQPCDRCAGQGSYHTTVTRESRVDHSCEDCGGSGRTPGLAARLFAVAPVEKVTLGDREPRQLGDGHWIWVGAWPQVASAVPPELRAIMDARVAEERRPLPWYSTREDALGWLSAAAVAFGRAAAGLPPLSR